MHVALAKVEVSKLQLTISKREEIHLKIAINIPDPVVKVIIGIAAHRGITQFGHVSC